MKHKAIKKGVDMKFSLFPNLCLAVLLVLLFPIVNSAYEPDEIPNEAKEVWKGYNGRQAGEALLKFRRDGDASNFASHFILFLDQGRTTRSILDLIKVVGLPFTTSEVSAIGDILAWDIPTDIRQKNATIHGYSLECHATPGTRISLVFLNADERMVYLRNYCNNEELKSPRDEEILANLEGRLCVWAKKRKIHLGGPHFVYERVVRILSRPSLYD